MASRILLISANRCTSPDPVFPLGLAHLSAALRAAGHEVKWLDVLSDGDGLEEAVTETRPDFVGISLRNIDDVLIRRREVFFGELVSLGERIRRVTRSPVIVGGSGFSIFPEQLLELAGADYGVRGEGEAGLVALIRALETGEPVESIPGLVYRRSGKVVLNDREMRDCAQGTDAADWPEALVDFYLQSGGLLNVQTQRGCGFRCCYCTYPVIEGRQHRGRPPELVAEEFERLCSLGAQYAFVVDSVFNSSARHVREICEALLRRNLKLKWGCFLRPQGLDAALMKLMARAGLSHIEFGSDSFCDDVLQAYGKGFGFDEIQHSTQLAAKENIEACHFLICGGPGETMDTLEASYRNAQKLPASVVMAVVGMRIYPGTPLYDRAVQEGIISKEEGLLQPKYYLAPGLDEAALFGALQRFAAESPGWIVGDPSPVYLRFVERLRQRGVVGPLWSYLALMRRLWPQGIPGMESNPI